MNNDSNDNFENLSDSKKLKLNKKKGSRISSGE